MKVKQEELVPNPGEEKKKSSFQIPGWFKVLSILRILQLGVGGLFVGEFFFAHGSWPILLLGSVLLWQGIFNRQMGCAGGHCRLPNEYVDRK